MKYLILAREELSNFLEEKCIKNLGGISDLHIYFYIKIPFFKEIRRNCSERDQLGG